MIFMTTFAMYQTFSNDPTLVFKKVLQTRCLIQGFLQKEWGKGFKKKAIPSVK